MLFGLFRTRPPTKRRIASRCLVLERLEDRLLLARTLHWTGAARFGPIPWPWWSAAANWKEKVAPTADDTVIFDGSSTADSWADLLKINTFTINAGYTGAITVAPGLTVTQTLAQSDGTIRGDVGELIVGDGKNKATFNWSGGTISGLGLTRFSVNSTVSLTGPRSKTFDDRLVVNEGTVNWQQGRFRLTDRALFYNSPRGLFEVTTVGKDDNMTGPAARLGRFINSGVFRKKIGVNTTQIYPRFDNSLGTVEVKTGTLELKGDGEHTGTFDAAAGAEVDFSSFRGSNTHTFKRGSSLKGGGVYSIVQDGIL